MRLACGSEEVREGLSNHIRESVEDAQYMQHLSKSQITSPERS